MPDYDESAAVEAFRRRVDARTISITAAYTILGLIGAFVVVALLFGLSNREWELGWLETLIVASFGSALGYVVGAERAFVLRLHAQMVLCQAALEQHAAPTLFDGAPTKVRAPHRTLLVKAGLKTN